MPPRHASRTQPSALAAASLDLRIKAVPAPDSNHEPKANPTSLLQLFSELAIWNKSRLSGFSLRQARNQNPNARSATGQECTHGPTILPALPCRNAYMHGYVIQSVHGILPTHGHSEACQRSLLEVASATSGKTKRSEKTRLPVRPKLCPSNPSRPV